MTIDIGFKRIYETSCVVKSNITINREYKRMVLDAPSRILDCEPGQFFHLLCPSTSELQPYFRRPMSIYGYYPDTGELHFLYKIAGEGTAALASLEPGEALNVVGPLGHGFEIRDDWQHLMVVARGVGLATLAPLAHKARLMGRKLTAICSARSPEVLMSIDHFRELGANVIPVTDSEGTSSVQNLERLIEQQITNEDVDAFYTCGSSRILHLLQSISTRYGIPGQIALEQQMACGVGMCQCCVRSFRRNGGIVNERVCKEGPVFDLQEAIA
nr:dihydroorotate dehydrogenase electron transfer subunit [uncultured Cohaesibacter sp.]